MALATEIPPNGPRFSRQKHQMPNRANMSCTFSQGTIFSPVSVSANVRSVIALGIRTSNGKPRWSLTC